MEIVHQKNANSYLVLKLSSQERNFLSLAIHMALSERARKSSNIEIVDSLLHSGSTFESLDAILNPDRERLRKMKKDAKNQGVRFLIPKDDPIWQSNNFTLSKSDINSLCKIVEFVTKHPNFPVFFRDMQENEDVTFVSYILEDLTKINQKVNISIN